ncbi:MAG: glycosyltransferase, partial [Rhodothermia bacterium]|nr:glycosyltransferase [Rhodothermia bacterium]
MANPAVSVGLPVFNGELFLAEAIQSLLSQSFEDLELIISDNGSSDDTESICREFAVSDSRVRYTRFDTNVGASRNFNRVFELSKGRYFKWAAHDDVHLPEYIEKCVEVLESDSAAVVAYTRAYSIDDSGSRLRDAWGESPELNSPSVDLRFRRCIGQQVNPIPLPIFGVMRSSALSRSRLFVDTPDSDRALLAELALHGRFRELEEVLFLQREHRRRAGPRLAENPY